ncbi:MAG: lysostaphin resistance A-like protein [Candidatus Korobacteraceae bacterium]
MFTTTTGRLRPGWAFAISAVLSFAAFFIAAVVAEAIARQHYLVLEVIFRPLAALLLIGAYLWLLTIADNVHDHRLAALGLPLAEGWRKQFVAGGIIGVALTGLAVAPIAIWGNVNVHFNFGLHLLPRAGAVLFVLVVGALAEELMFRGYPFQRLEEGIGASGAIAVFSILFGAVHLSNPGASFWGLINTVLIGIVLALAYLRTRALWLPWGVHFGWNAALGFLFGLPVSGLRLFNVIVRTSATGPTWLTGGSYGIEASATGTIAILIGLVIVCKLPVKKGSCKWPVASGQLATPGSNLDSDDQEASSKLA